jgi:hypothetical protein
MDALVFNEEMTMPYEAINIIVLFTSIACIITSVLFTFF